MLTALGYLDAEPSIGIAVVDGGSPWFDGLALIERMRQSHRGVRCILFASNPGTEDMVRAIRLQVADVVTDVHDDVQVEHALTRSLAALGDRRPDPLRHMPIHLNGSAEALEQAYRHGLALIETMRALRGEAVPARIVPFAPSPRPAHAPAGAAAEEGSPSDSLAALQAIQRKRAARDKFFPKGLFEDPCWDMLLDLMINHLEGRRISVSSLCIASGVAQTTALRRIADLHAQGLVRRIADEKDGRRVFIELTEAGKAAMKQYVESAGSLE
ncbi:MAG TPA: winged helix DNA-binding protein [Azospirillum sp.]|nr:winged helix DNA-binding protein [Azospirillum sp.]